MPAVGADDERGRSTPIAVILASFEPRELM
jgi:hypothetical protein